MPKTEKLTYVSLLSDESIHGKYEKALKETEGELGHSHPHYVGGRELSSGSEFEAWSPVDTDILIGRFQKGGADVISGAIREAREAFPGWSGTDWRERVRAIRGVVESLERNMYRYAAIITYESGKNRYEAVAEVAETVDMLACYCDLYEQHDGYVLPMTSEVPGESCRSVLKPHGVWAVISPFNFPLVLAANMVSAALLAGNTVVLKPTSTAPLSVFMLYRELVDNGVPQGAVNLVTGPGRTFGDAIVSTTDIDGIAFTGSMEAGMWLFRNFNLNQPHNKPFVAEMGSKNPCIVTASADIEKAVEGVVNAAFGYGGQKCSANSRVYLESSIAGEFTKALKKRVDGIVVGDPREKEVFYGPLVNSKALDKFTGAVEEIKKAGGSILTGGGVLKDGSLSRGCYVQPTVGTGLPHDHRLFGEELFVPLLLVDTFKTLDEALKKANSTGYGLTAGIFSEDDGEIEKFFDAIEFGVCYSNRSGGATTGAWPGAQSFGGWKASGSTGKGVGGPYYLLSFLREQSQTRVKD